MVEVASSNALQHNPHGAQAQLLSVVANFMNRHLYRRDLGLAEDPRFLQNRKVFGELLADQLLDDLLARGVGVYDTSTILQDSHIRCIGSSSGARHQDIILIPLSCMLRELFSEVLSAEATMPYVRFA